MRKFLNWRKMATIAKLYRILTGGNVIPDKDSITELINNSSGELKILLLSPLFSCVQYQIDKIIDPSYFFDFYPKRMLKLLKARDRLLYNVVLCNLEIARKTMEGRYGNKRIF